MNKRSEPKGEKIFKPLAPTLGNSTRHRHTNTFKSSDDLFPDNNIEGRFPAKKKTESTFKLAESAPAKTMK